MNISLIIPALLFTAVGVVIIAYTIRLFLSAAIGNPWGWLERQKLTKKEKLLAEGDAHFKADNHDLALSCWKNAFYLDSFSHQSSLVDLSHNLNINVLGRLVSISDKRSTHIINLPIVEELLADRTDLLHTLFETKQTLNKLRLRKKGDSSAKSSPQWALKEFSKKHAEIKTKVDANRSKLEAELKKLFDSLSRLSGSNEITYH